METKSSVLLIIVLCGICASVSNGEEGRNRERVDLEIEAETYIAKTDDNFICATLDWWPTDKCDYGQCPIWSQQFGFVQYHPSKCDQGKINETAFGELRIRVGGSLQDQVMYKVGNGVKDCSDFKRNDDGLFDLILSSTNPSTLFNKYRIWLMLNRILDSYTLHRAKVTFGLNALFGREKSKTDEGLWIGEWNAKNSYDIMKYSIEKGYKIDSYELGNELCSSGVSARVEVKQYAQDMKKLKSVVQKLYQDEKDQPKVLGPAGFYDEKWFNEFLLHSGPDVVDGLTHHIYNLGAGVDKTLIDKIQDPFFLSQVAQTYKDVSNTVDRFGPWAGAWVGEAGGAYNSGGKDVSHTFANGFWYIDQLGMTSMYNHKVFCRQALVGGIYALLNTSSFIPNPDYYGALLWHRLMGSRVLQAIHNTSPHLRIYAHCARQHLGGVTLVVINLSNTESYELFLEEYARVSLKKREEYMDGDIQSDVVLLNGKALRLTESEDIPELKPKLVDSSTAIHVKQDSIVFVSLKDFNAPACA